MPPRSRRARACLTPLPYLVLTCAVGCEEPMHVGGGLRPKATAAAPAPAPPPTPPPVQPRAILGKRTQDIRQMEPEQQQGARIASTKITAKDPITLPGNAYVT